MPTYKLTYFNVTALGETLRFLLSYGNIEFEDVRIKVEDWPTIKPTFYWGQLPVLEIDGKPVTQSLAIARYLAKKVGLAGRDDWEELQINMAVDIVNDFRLKVIFAGYETDKIAKERRMAELNDYCSNVLPKIDALAKSGYFANGRLSLADIYMAAISKYLVVISGKNVFQGNPNILKVISNVEAVPTIKKWIEKRPESLM